MKKKYLEMNVYDSLMERFKFIFEEFENIYVSFSGGKDSGLLLYLLLDYKRKYYPNREIGVYHQDFEAQYDYTTQFVLNTFEQLKDEVKIYWVCLPMATRTALSNYQMYWYPWDDLKESNWIRSMPDNPFVISLKNKKMTTYRYKMHQEDLAKQFGRWYKKLHNDTSTICLLGMRSDESLQRYNSFLNKKAKYKNRPWITQNFKNVFCGSPLYDWSTSDVWHAIFKFNYPYNELYNMFFKAGLSPSLMRVASPFNDYAKESLNLYRVIEPETWEKLLLRVKGVNFGSIYGKSKALGYRNVTLPDGYTWKAYTKFLLSTLPYKIRQSYINKFKTSIDFWHNVGGGLEECVYQELLEKGYQVTTNGVSNYTVFKNKRIIFLQPIPDDTDNIKSTKELPSWKRMCYCILKNDHLCRYMGFSITRQQKQYIDTIKEKYKVMEEM